MLHYENVWGEDIKHKWQKFLYIHIVWWFRKLQHQIHRKRSCLLHSHFTHSKAWLEILEGVNLIKIFKLGIVKSPATNLQLPRLDCMNRCICVVAKSTEKFWFPKEFSVAVTRVLGMILTGNNIEHPCKELFNKPLKLNFTMQGNINFPYSNNPFKGAVTTKYKFGLLKGLLYPCKGTSFIVNIKWSRYWGKQMKQRRLPSHFPAIPLHHRTICAVGGHWLKPPPRSPTRQL